MTCKGSYCVYIVETSIKQTYDFELKNNLFTLLGTDIVLCFLFMEKKKTALNLLFH